MGGDIPLGAADAWITGVRPGSHPLRPNWKRLTKTLSIDGTPACALAPTTDGPVPGCGFLGAVATAAAGRSPATWRGVSTAAPSKSSDTDAEGRLVLADAIAFARATLAPALILVGLVSVFAVSTLAGWRPSLPTGIDRRLRPLVGLVSGLVGGMSSFLAPTLVPYLITLGLEKTAFVHIMGVLFLLGQLPLFAGLAIKGFAPPGILALSAAGWVVVGLSMSLGNRLRDRIPQKHFMTLVGVMLLLIGLNMIRRVVF